MNDGEHDYNLGGQGEPHGGWENYFARAAEAKSVAEAAERERQRIEVVHNAQLAKEKANSPILYAQIQDLTLRLAQAEQTIRLLRGRMFFGTDDEWLAAVNRGDAR